MPARKYVTEDQEEMSKDVVVGADWLIDKVRDPASQILILDCRSHTDFYNSRIRGAINVTFPASVIMLRRLANGKLCITSLIKDQISREKFTRMWQTHTIVLYDTENESIRPGPCVFSTLYKRLVQDGCHVVCLQGGFNNFKTEFPEWCDSNAPDSADSSIIALENLRITPLSESDQDIDKCDSGVSGDTSPNDPPFPVEILPFLFLGNAENSCDLEALERHKIHYILNVTPNLPNRFEQDDVGIKYMQIPIQDHWSQNLASFFPEAIAFIEEARQKKHGVLVHCLAGISRSVTITLAYLMHKLSMPLNDAYDFVRQRKANISPNINFMGQLLDFERQLNLTPCSCTCHETPCKCQALHFTSPTRTTPDSGIDIDRWT